MEERVKPIVITIKDTDEKYTLEFSRETVQTTIRTGFRRAEIDDRPEEMIPLLFYGAFLMHHPKMSKRKTDNILENVLHGLDPDWLERLVELYNSPLKETVHEKDEEEIKNMGAVVEL